MIMVEFGAASYLMYCYIIITLSKPIVKISVLEGDVVKESVEPAALIWGL